MSERNGNGWKTWVLGALLAAVFGLSSVAWSSHGSQIQELKTDTGPLRERITKLEERSEFIREQIWEMRQQLNRIEARQIQNGQRR